MNDTTPTEFTCPIRRAGSGMHHHFFGYYNKTPWDLSGRYMLAHRVPVMDAKITPEFAAQVGFFDLAAGDLFHLVGETTAWNWQMGSQLQWLDAEPQRSLIYNARTNNADSVYPRLGAIIYNTETGERRELSMPIYSVAPNSKYALCIDYRRLYVTHQTIGYPDDQIVTPCNAPENDGIHFMDIATGTSRLILSYRDLQEFHPRVSMEKAVHWVSHIEINPASSRVLLLHRWTERVEDETCFLHRLITMNPDGTALRLLECSDHPLPQLAQDFDPAAVGTYDYEKSEYQISHPLWKNDDEIVVWSPHDGNIHYHVYTDAEQSSVEVIGRGILTENGHMTFAPADKRWLATDTYPDPEKHLRSLLIFDVLEGGRHNLGAFYATPALSKENRCDLHPRWSRNGSQICIDSVHESERQMYIIDIGSIVGSVDRSSH